VSSRVIAGELGGRVLKVPRGLGTRPTGAKVREALFNVLAGVSGAKVLDLYAGSGALALEALSRGAERAVLVEHERAALACIRDNVAALGLGARVEVVPLRLPRALTRALVHGPFDLVLCDPPWADLSGACATLAELSRLGGLAAGARVALEHSAKDSPPEISGLPLVDRRTWGDTAVSLFAGSVPI
jgi:16S rRNA (guanine966-N2)-methyltransferase